MMADRLTQAERDAISSFPPERIKRYPTGFSALYESVEWVKRTENGGYLRAANPVKLRDRIRASVAASKAYKRRMGL